MKKFLIAGAAILALGAAAGSVAVAQDAPPTVKVALGKSAVTVEGAEALKAGTTRFEFSVADGREQVGELFALAPGRTVEEFEEALRKRLYDALEVGTLEAGVTLLGKSAKRAVTVTLEPGVAYAALQATADNAARWRYSTFTVGQETSTAVAPTPDATVRFVDFGFPGSKRLPRDGVVRFENRGKAPHFAVAFPLRKRADANAAVRAMKQNREKRFRRMMGGPPVEPQGLITGGAVNDVELRFAKRGKYVLACFFSDRPGAKPHTALGMVSAVTVR